LSDHGLLESAADETIPDAARFASAVSSTGIDGRTAAARAAECTVNVLGSSRLARLITEALEDTGVATATHAAGARWTDGKRRLVLAAFDGGAEAFQEINADRIADGVPWLPVAAFDGRVSIIGPFIVPGESACYDCYQLRRGAASGYAHCYQDLARLASTARPSRAWDSVIAGSAALVVTSWAVGEPLLRGGEFYAVAYDGEGLEQTRNTVLRVPRCLLCSRRQASPPMPWALRAAATRGRE
jgi:bacteriocin biosynthesis cyclodehydratase domain-containing protein